MRIVATSRRGSACCRSPKGRCTASTATPSRELADWFHAGRPATIAFGFEARDEKFNDHANVPVAAQARRFDGLSTRLRAIRHARSLRRFHRTEHSGAEVPGLHRSRLVTTTTATSAARPTRRPASASSPARHSCCAVRSPRASARRRCMTSTLRRPTARRAPSDDPAHSTVGVRCYGQPHLHGGCRLSVDRCLQHPIEVLNGGNKSLKPEKSKNATLGIVLEPFKDFTFGVRRVPSSFTNQISVGGRSRPVRSDRCTRSSRSTTTVTPTACCRTDGSSCPGTDCGYIDTRTQNLGGVITNGLDIGSTTGSNAVPPVR